MLLGSKKQDLTPNPLRPIPVFALHQNRNILRRGSPERQGLPSPTTNRNEPKRLKLGVNVQGFATETIKRRIAELCETGICDDSVLSTVVQNDTCAPIEFECLDYKAEVDLQDKICCAEICKDIVAFHNRYGGYLVFGVRESGVGDFRICGVSKISDFEPLRSKIRDFTGERIQFSSCNVEYTYNNTIYTIQILLIPKRSEGAPLVGFKKDGPTKGSKNTPIFREEEIFFRDSDECRRATAVKVFELKDVRRHPIFTPENQPALLPSSRISHNLPERSLICPKVIGREAAIDHLWRWLSDDLSHVKVLAGEGGIGKSTIAYEFADQVTSTQNIPFYQALWLSAKERQFRPYRNTYEELPEVQFSSYRELLLSICEHLAITSDEVDGSDDIKLLRLIKQGLRTFPSLIVLDDIDSLDATEQKRALEVGLALGGSSSKLLLTTRRNVSYSQDICYEVEGLSSEEFPAFFDNLLQRYPAVGRAPVSERDVSSIYVASHGSPLFAESILRLMAFEPAADAIRKWKNAEGDAVRRAALEREIGQLLPEAKLVLFCLALLGEASVSEIEQVSEYSREKVTHCLDSLSTLFLVDAVVIGNERRFALSETTSRLVHQLKNSLTTNSAKVERAALDLRKSASEHGRSKGNETVAKAIRQAASQERRGEIKEAFTTLQDALRHTGRKKGVDLISYIAHLHLSYEPKSFNDARLLAREAYSLGSRKSRLFETWFNSEWEASNFVGAEECARIAISLPVSPKHEWYLRLAASITAKANEQQSGLVRIASLSKYLEASDVMGSAIACAPYGEQSKYKEGLAAITDTIWAANREASKSCAEWQLACNHLEKAIELGDIRFSNYKRLIECGDRALDFISGSEFPERHYAALSGIMKSIDSAVGRRLAKFPEDARNESLRISLQLVRGREASVIH
jgi:hypothetical protein